MMIGRKYCHKAEDKDDSELNTSEDSAVTIAGYYQVILEALGMDMKTDSMRKTPTRAAKAMLTFTEGYNMSLTDIVNNAISTDHYEGLVIVRDTQMFSTCEHHLMPFFGKVTIGYQPNTKILGLSKFARIVQLFSRRLQGQERLTRQIAEGINEILEPKGVGVIIEATHSCMMVRGVQQYNSQTRTTYMLGSFKTDALVMEEFGLF